jgi:CRISPR system Cascade subunit CasB
MTDTGQKTEPQERQTRGSRFVEYVTKQAGKDTGLLARLKRADNPATEYQSWEILASFGVDIAWENQRLPYCLIAASLARSKVREDGTLSIGQAIAACFEQGNASDQAKSRLRRVLACSSIDEICRILRTILTLIESKQSIRINYARLLDDLLRFSKDEWQSDIKAKWAKDFYKQSAPGVSDD